VQRDVSYEIPAQSVLNGGFEQYNNSFPATAPGWAFNGYGYFWGMLIGIVTALIVPATLPIVAPSFHDPTYAFPVILLLSFAGCIAGALLTKPVDEEVLKSFYRNVRPWGFWKPVYEMVKAEDAGLQPNNDAIRDLSNCVVGIVWQLMLVTIPLYVIFRNFTAVLICAGILIITSIFLKIRWYNHLEKDETIANAGKSSQTTEALSQ